MEPNVTVREAARMLHVTPRTIRNWVAAGKLTATRISERVTLVPLCEVERVAGRAARPDLSSVIWDVDLSTLDEDRNAAFIVRRVLESGRPDQVSWLFRRYGEARVAAFAQGDRALPVRDRKAWLELLKRRRARAA